MCQVGWPAVDAISQLTLDLGGAMFKIYAPCDRSAVVIWHGGGRSHSDAILGMPPSRETAMRNGTALGGLRSRSE